MELRKTRRRQRTSLALAMTLAVTIPCVVAATATDPVAPPEGDAPAPDTDHAAVLADILALKARASMELRRDDHARDSAEKALALDARNVMALQVLADLADRGDDWREQVRRWEQVANATSDDRYREMALRRAESIVNENSNEIWFDSYYSRDDSGEALSGLASGARIVNDNGPDVLAEIRTRAAEGETAGRVDGRGADALGGSVGLSSRSGKREWENLLVFSDHELGSTGLWQINRENGYSGVRYRYNTPAFHYAGAIVEDASEDYLGVSLGQSIGRWWMGTTAGVANYTIGDRIGVARSLRLDATLDLRLGQAGPRASYLRYHLGVENFSDITDATTAMSTEDQRVHSLSVLKRLVDRHSFGSLGSGWLEAELGYRIKQNDYQGVFANLSSGMAVGRHRKLELSIQYEDLQNDIGDREAPLGVALTFRQLTGG